jgi:putative PIN family toxin of toxin-antitoxin system
MKVVIDTVVLVRSLIGPYSWWGRLVFDYPERYELVVSPPIVAEYLNVVHRPRLLRKFQAVATRDLRTILNFVANATVVQPLSTPAVCRDPGDDKFLAAAKSSGARFIVTEDADLLEIGTYETTTIVSSEAFLRMLDAAEIY